MPASPDQNAPTRVGLIGDVHAQDKHLATALEHLVREGAEVLLCTGDLADGSGDIERCVALLKDYEVLTVRGNHDRWLLEDRVRHVPNAHTRETVSEAVLDYLGDLPSERHITTTAGPLMLCHGMGKHDLTKIWPGTKRMPAERSKHLDTLIAEGDVRWIVNGHVHYRTLIHFRTLTLINAGTLRGDHHPGFSLLDLAAAEVVGFELEPAVHEVRTHPLTPTPDTRVFEDTQHFDGDWDPVTLYA